MDNIILTKKQNFELESWLQQQAWEIGGHFNHTDLPVNPITKNGDKYEQKWILGLTIMLKEKILLEVERLMGIPLLESSTYTSLSDNVMSIVKFAAEYIPAGWALSIEKEYLVMSRRYNSFDEIWAAKLDHLVAESDRPTIRKKVTIEVEVLNSMNHFASLLHESAKGTFCSLGRIHDIQVEDNA